MIIRLLSILNLLILSFSVWAGSYHLEVDHEMVNITGKPVKKITLNGTIPGPILKFREGEEVVISVTNNLDEATSIHWHGFIVLPEMDGVPEFNGFRSIPPHQTFAYRFPIQQSGTYWYHAHSDTQEQDGLYGSIVITPKDKDPIQADRDYVVLLADFTEEDSDDILKHLKMDAGYYNYAKQTLIDFFTEAKNKGFKTAWQERKEWGQMRMSPTDLADVSGYTFLVNGKTPAQNWTGLFKAGERIRLRFINASAMTFYDVRIPGLKLWVVQADGQNVEPVPVDEFRFGIAETYDVIVQPEENKAYSIVAEPIDRTGFALGTLAPRFGMKGEAPTPRSRALLTMADMGMAHGQHAGYSTNTHQTQITPANPMDHSAHQAHGASSEEMKSGWADAGTPPGHKALSYADLRYLDTQKDTRAPEREIVVTLGGNMERFIWTMNGKKFEDTEPVQLKYGERVRLKFINETMMAHPMHLHGMFVQLENGQPAEKLPNKHTVIVAPGQSYSVLLTADAPGEWAFHCHLLYHMLAGMMSKVVVAKLDENAVPIQPAQGGHQHAH